MIAECCNIYTGVILRAVTTAPAVFVVCNSHIGRILTYQPHSSWISVTSTTKTYVTLSNAT